MKKLRISALFVVLGLVAAACASPAPSGMLEQLGEGEGELNLVIWAGYAERGENDPTYDWVTPFEDETGCQVNTTDMTDSGNGVDLMQTGEYDGISASGDATLRLIAAGTVAPVNVELIPNYDDIFEGLKLQPHNSVDDVPYGVPHGRGANLLMYNTDVIAEAPTSWALVWEDAGMYSGQVSIYNYAIYIADAALHLMQTNPELGIENPYQLNQEQFDAAVAILQDQSEHAIYWGTAAEQIQSFAAEEAVVGTTWQYQANQLTDSPIAVTLPDEGSTGWSDTWMIASDAANPNCMYMWMNHMASAEANAEATVWFGEAATSDAACEAAEALSPGHCETFHATDEEYFARVWYWATPQADCADDDDATECVDWDAWVEAWTGIVGG
ncbi:MAG: extracellular solute-binding protein [Candidatus Limnocylindria bacterium]